MKSLMKTSVWPEESLHEFDVGDSEITKRQILSINILLKYFEETEELVKIAPNEVSEIDVAIDNRVLVLREMPFPPQFKKELCQFVYNGGKLTAENVTQKIKNFFVMKKTECLAVYQDQKWAEMHNLDGSLKRKVFVNDKDYDDKENFAARLRRLRAEIY